MSFPVPVEYGLNDTKDNTIVKYNNGTEWEGLPSPPEGGGGGGGLTTVASGSFTGSSVDGRQTLNIGTKMAQTDFYLLVKARDNSEFVRNGYSMTFFETLVLNAIGYYDLTQSGKASFISNFPVYDDNNGVLTLKNGGNIVKDGGRINNGNTGEISWNTLDIYRRDDHFEIYFGQSNVSYNLPANITYDYELVYFGDDPQNDIITI